MDIVGDDQQALVARSDARATSSVVVPILMNSEELLGMRAAALAPMRCFSSSAILRRAS